MFKGVAYAGIGVSDMEQSLPFYQDELGFKEIAFDYSGSLPGLEKITNKPETNARVVMLRNPKVGPMGLGMIELVQLLPPDKPEPIPEGGTWGEIGVGEISVHVRGHKKIHDELVEKGWKCTVAAGTGEVPPTNAPVNFSYISGPDEAKIELIEWTSLSDDLGAGPGIEGLNHVEFGVSDMDKSMIFYKSLGFTELLMDYKGVMEDMASFFPEPFEQRVVILLNYHGCGIEPVQNFPSTKDLRGAWGHLGPMEFAIGVNNLEKACEELNKKGIELLCDPQSIDVSSGEWKYAYIVEPDNNYVSLVEARF
jgi:catechol 2,3-dioxygenase-like lactoylglutathione lyase family enzyme